MWIFKPIFKETIWGGRDLLPFKGIPSDCRTIGESWELSGVEGNESVVAAGPDAGLTLPELIGRYGASLMGDRNYKRFGKRFPLLVKLLDAAQPLSVQVHPDDIHARQRGEENGKTEMWYVIKAAPGAKLAGGFTEKVDPESYEQLVESGGLEKVLRWNTVSPGEVFFIPGGRVHSLGAGCMVAEIQQTSDTTYRIYDYHRLDSEGKPRKLHVKEAAGVINFNDTAGTPTDYLQIPDIPVNLVDCQSFTVNLLKIDEKLIRDYRENDSFVILTATEGSAMLCSGGNGERLECGHTVLIPASATNVMIIPDGRISLLESYVK